MLNLASLPETGSVLPEGVESAPVLPDRLSLDFFTPEVAIEPYFQVILTTIEPLSNQPLPSGSGITYCGV